MGAQRSFQLRAYVAFSAISEPLWRLALSRREKRGKEDPARLSERLGQPGRERPKGPLLWFHALSVGESLALLALLDRILDRHGDTRILLTTGTRTSAEALARQNLPKRVIHQMVPIDARAPVRRFLDHWQPDLAVFAELDFWPALMSETHRRRIPMALINSRMSDHNFQKRKSGAALFRDLLDMFEIALVQDDGTRDRFIALGCDPAKISVLGALKGAPRPLPADAETLSQFHTLLADRPVWLAASTEAREQETVIDAHRDVLAQNPNALLILAPRHPSEADHIADTLSRSDLTFVRRSAGDTLTPKTQVLLADTIGEMGLWYRLSPVTFMGHSLKTTEPVLRGKNPFEAAVLDTALIHGPNVVDFEESYDALDTGNAALALADNADLAPAVISLWSSDLRDVQLAAARSVLATTARVLDETYDALEPLISVARAP